MNIKEHIEAGHYPVDDKGRALVPTQHGAIATICATDKPGEFCIVGWVPTEARAQSLEATWCKDGGLKHMGNIDLLPPPPRKVKVMTYAILYGSGICAGRIGHFQSTREDADKFAAGWTHHDAFVVELTGEYEEQWS